MRDNSKELGAAVSTPFLRSSSLIPKSSPGLEDLRPLYPKNNAGCSNPFRPPKPPATVRTTYTPIQ